MGRQVPFDILELTRKPVEKLNIAEIFIHRAKGRHVNTAIVGGEVIMEDRKFLNVDVAQLYDEVRTQAAKGINPQQRSFAEVLQKIKPYYQRWYKSWVEELDLQPFYVMEQPKMM